MQIAIDARALRMYPVGRLGFSGGTEQYLHQVAKGLADKGHVVHVITPDLDRPEMRAPTLWYWPPLAHPSHVDCVVAWHSLEFVSPDADYDAPILVCATNGLGADLGPNDDWAKWVDGWPVFSRSHADLLTKHHPNVDPAKCHVTGLGIELADYGYEEMVVKGKRHRRGPLKAIQPSKVPGRMFFSNDPARGLWHALDVFDDVKKRVPDASLHVAYGFDRDFERTKWGSHALAELMWECRDRLANTPGVVDLGDLDRPSLIREQLECQVHAMPSDPPNTGSQIHGLTQMECAAAGAALVLSDIEAFPEVFGDAATILPLPGTFLPQLERRYDAQDWAEAVVRLMQDGEAWAEASRKARELAEQHTWTAVISKWDAMLAALEASAMKPAVTA